MSRVHVIIFVSRSVVEDIKVTSVPSAFVLMPGLAGVHPVDRVSLIMVLTDVAAQPLLSTDIWDSKTVSSAITIGVSLTTLIIAKSSFCSIEWTACICLLMLLG